MGIKRRSSIAPSRAPARSAPAPARVQPPAPRQQTPPAPQRAMTPSNTHQHNHPTQPHMMPQQHHPQPMMQQRPMMQQQPMMMPQQQSGGLMGNIGSGIMNGMTFGVGSAVAHRAVDSIMGPRTVEHVHTGQEPAAEPTSQQAQHQPQHYQPPQQSMQQPPQMQQPQQQPMHNNNANCGIELDYFQRCMQLNNNSIDACSQYSTALQQCQRR